MKAFVEITGLIVRVGPKCDSWGAPFEFACVGIGSGGALEIKALAGKGGTRAHISAVLRALAPLGFTSIAYQHKGKFANLLAKMKAQKDVPKR